MRATPPVCAILFSLAACSGLSMAAAAQGPAQESIQAPSGSALPTAPAPAVSAGSVQPFPSPLPSSRPHPVETGFQPGAPLTLHDRFILEARTTFGPAAFLVPAGEAAITMADPPHSYPPAWSDGGGAFGRNYGSEFVRHTTGGLAHFAVAAIIREDPRYYASSSTNPAARFFHALAFTLVDRSDSGRHTIAFSNLAGSAAAGFIGMAYLPDGFNDTTHAYQRAAVEVSNFAAHNLTAEFAPELASLAHKLHFPDRVADSFLPPDRKTP